MMQWEQRRTWLMGLVLVGSVGLLVSCGGSGGEGCGGIEDVVSCVSITSITPKDVAGTATSRVDAIQDVCNPATTPTPEPFGAHTADITFSNAQHPNASNSFDVTLQRVSVSYSLNNCPIGAVCPPLPGFTQSVPTLVIPKGGTASLVDFPFVPLSVKTAYVNQGGDTTRFPSYSANYVFTGQTQFFNDTLTIEGNAAFTIGNSNLCE
jgi:hypothetical protein